MSSSMPQDFGSHLKHEREMRGISLEEIAASTKIQIRYLQALENNQFDQLPGTVFIKGFVRSYAKTIGCNADDLISAYDESIGSPQQDADQIERDLADRQDSQGRSARINLLGGVALVAVLAVGGWYLIAPQSSSLPKLEDSMEGEVPASEVVMGNPSAPAMAGPEQKPVASLAEPAEDAPTRTPAMDLQSTPVQASEPTILDNGVSKSENGAIIKATQDPLNQNVSDDSSASAETLGHLRLVIRVSDNSWFNLQIDNSREMDFIMPAGARKTILARGEIRITVGNQRSTQLTLNDQILVLPESPDNVVRNLIVNTEMIE
ncbi:MAG: helix-turn-helix domain-containing protein [Nitrospina sp.]|nr:MAG: helix-turn-helix domain-containing protein [Nitrospina sp.]